MYFSAFLREKQSKSNSTGKMTRILTVTQMARKHPIKIKYSTIVFPPACIKTHLQKYFEPTLVCLLFFFHIGREQHAFYDFMR